ncbi:hypothetical protein SVIOM74S_10475 [Streptomyces violarus]
MTALAALLVARAGLGPAADGLGTGEQVRGVVGCGVYLMLVTPPTAASRRSLGRVSVPVWPVALSGRLPVVALVSHYLTNKLIGRGPTPARWSFRTPWMPKVVSIRY